MTHHAVTQAPWPYYTQKQAAKQLGVHIDWLRGLVNNPIPAVKTHGKTGAIVWLFQREAIDNLKKDTE